jgi:hypothetical protein
MKRILFAAGIAIFAASTPAFAQRGCVVNDPTGTPLNVRSSPNGPILGALYNGTRVSLIRVVNTGGRTWAYVSAKAPAQSGFVFRAFLDC